MQQLYLNKCVVSPLNVLQCCRADRVLYATTLKFWKKLCCGYVWAMRRFGGSGQRAYFGSNEDASLFKTLKNAVYVRFMPQKVHIRALLLLGYLQPLQTFLRCAHRNSQSSFSHDDTTMYRADAPICPPSGQYPILWDPQYVILKPFTCSISLLCLVGHNNYFSEKCILVSSLLVVLVCVFNWIASSIEFYSIVGPMSEIEFKQLFQHSLV